MTQEEITQGNKLIAEFMGGKLQPFNSNINIWIWPDPTLKSYNEALSEDSLKFNSSWEWLMGVVEKIMTIQLPSPSMIPVGVQIHNYGCTIMDGCWSPSVIVENTTTENPNVKELTYKSVVEFIKWFNEQNKQ